MSEGPIPATRERPGSYDALATAKPGEPLFPIQGGDPFGPATVLHWARLARQAGMAERDAAKAERLLRKASDAELIAWAMEDYQRGVDFSSSPPPANPATERRSGRGEAAARLHNLTAELVAVAELLAGLRTRPETEVELREGAAMIKRAALTIEPRRGLERS